MGPFSLELWRDSRLWSEIVTGADGDYDGDHEMVSSGADVPAEVMKVHLLSGVWVVEGFAGYVGHANALGHLV